jgi:hypothetical protein
MGGEGEEPATREQEASPAIREPCEGHPNSNVIVNRVISFSRLDDVTQENIHQFDASL